MPNLAFPPPSWAELVFHVLAHVPAAGVPSSVYSPWYVQFAAEHLGASSERALGRDVAVLGRLFPDHRRLCGVQGLAWLWRDVTEALACAERELSELRAGDLAEHELLLASMPETHALELLRCACLLEAEAFARLPVPTFDHAAFDAALARLVPHAPALKQLCIKPLRSLTCHGRLRGEDLWIGVPDCGVTLEMAAMQAAHEASVREVRVRRPTLPERELEAVALVLLSERITGSPHAVAHRAWCRAHQVRAEHLDRNQLSPTQRDLLVP
jgi:hypothetical protein